MSIVVLLEIALLRVWHGKMMEMENFCETVPKRKRRYFPYFTLYKELGKIYCGVCKNYNEMLMRKKTLPNINFPVRKINNGKLYRSLSEKLTKICVIGIIKRDFRQQEFFRIMYVSEC